MAFLLGSLVFVSIAATIVLVVFAVAMNRRWFAALPSGFTASLIVALVATGIFAVWLSGAWGYRAARAIISEQVVVNLRNVGDIVERQIQDELDEAFLQLNHLAGELPPDLAQMSASDLEHDLREVAHVNTRFLQLAVIDPAGRRLAVTTLAAAPQPIPHIAVAYCLDGKTYASDPYPSTDFQREGHGAREHVMDLCVPIQSGAAVIGTLNARFDVQDNLSDLLASAVFNQSGRATLVGSDGHVLADPDPKHIDADLSRLDAARLALNGTIGSVTATTGGVPQLVFYRPIRNPATVNAKPWALLTQINASEAAAPLNGLASQIVLGIFGIAVASIVVASILSVSLTRPIGALVAFARRVQEGDLTARADVTGRDAHGQLADALNAMVNGLRERDRVKEVFGRYVATQVSEKVLRGEVNLGGERRRVTILFSDIRDFTTMSEQMPAEQVVEFLNEYFSEMVEAVFDHHGMLDKFIGDGLMAVFGATDDEPEHPKQAVRAALRMKSLLAKINGDRAMRGKKPIAMGIGIHTDEVIVGNIGSRRRLEFTVVGDGVNTSSRLESLNKQFGTTILISESTYTAIKDEFICRPMQQATLKGKVKDVAFYEVISMAGELAPAV